MAFELIAPSTRFNQLEQGKVAITIPANLKVHNLDLFKIGVTGKDLLVEVLVDVNTRRIALRKSRGNNVPTFVAKLNKRKTVAAISIGQALKRLAVEDVTKVKGEYTAEFKEDMLILVLRDAKMPRA